MDNNDQLVCVLNIWVVFFWGGLLVEIFSLLNPACRPEKTLYLDTFQAVISVLILSKFKCADYLLFPSSHQIMISGVIEVD